MAYVFTPTLLVGQKLCELHDANFETEVFLWSTRASILSFKCGKRALHNIFTTSAYSLVGHSIWIACNTRTATKLPQFYSPQFVVLRADKVRWQSVGASVDAAIFHSALLLPRYPGTFAQMQMGPKRFPRLRWWLKVYYVGQPPLDWFAEQHTRGAWIMHALRLFTAGVTLFRPTCIAPRAAPAGDVRIVSLSHVRTKPPLVDIYFTA